jgi:hypothetical protein
LDVLIPFEHRQTAHCESGVISSLLRHHRRPISEPMAFGISSGLTFAYLPMIKFGGLPLFAYRMPPKSVIRGVTKRLGITMAYETFRDPARGTAALDAHLAAGRVVGLQTSVFWLDYFPADMRFHFNAHNLVVYGKRAGRYLISDPVLDTAVECPAASLEKARFVRGVMAPKGLLYYPRSLPERFELAPAILKAIRWTSGMMLHTPLPFIGVRGIRMVARKIARLPREHGRENRLLIGHMVRMQEEIGTGGAGFRFLYASFLQEASEVLGRPALAEIATELTAAGDQWRAAALFAAKMCKERVDADYARLGGEIALCADLEAAVFRRLRAEV